MRNLKLKDAFAVSRILKKMHIRFEFEQGMTNAEMQSALILKFVESVGEAEEEVLAFFADLKGMEPEELAELDFEELATIIEEFSQLKGLQNFFTQVGKLMK